MITSDCLPDVARRSTRSDGPALQELRDQAARRLRQARLDLLFVKHHVELDDPSFLEAGDYRRLVDITATAAGLVDAVPA